MASLLGRERSRPSDLLDLRDGGRSRSRARPRSRAGRVLPGRGISARPAPRPRRLGAEPARTEPWRPSSRDRRSTSPRCCAGASRARPARGSTPSTSRGSSRSGDEGVRRPVGRPGTRVRCRDGARAAGEGTARLGSRAGRALRRPHNWLQLAKFCAVGATGYVVNLAVFTLLYEVFAVHYMAAAVFSFCVAVTNNYLWNRLWTFRGAARPLLLPGPALFHRRLVCACGEPPRARGARRGSGSTRSPRRRSPSSSSRL